MLSQILEFIANHALLSLAFVLALAAVLFNEYRNLTAGFKAVGPLIATRIINDEDPLILDVRENSEVKDGIIADALHIPLGELSRRMAELEPYKDRTVLIYCRSGSRSASAARRLRRAGFEKVYNLAGGIMAWVDQHLPVVRPGSRKNKGKNRKKK